jgi:hypothetical protein
MAYHKVYSISHDGKWTVRYNKKIALKLAKIVKGEVRSLSVGYWNDCHKSMDWPTFYAGSEQVANFAQMGKFPC